VKQIIILKSHKKAFKPGTIDLFSSLIDMFKVKELFSVKKLLFTILFVFALANVAVYSQTEEQIAAFNALTYEEYEKLTHEEILETYDIDLTKGEPAYFKIRGGDEFCFTADDGTKIFLVEEVWLNPNPKYKPRTTFGFDHTAYTSFYYLICENRTHILHIFYSQRGQLSECYNKIKEKFTLFTKDKEYGNYTTYRTDLVYFSIFSPYVEVLPIPPTTLFLWLDKEDDTSCASISNIRRIQSVDEIKADYGLFKDIYIGYITDELNDYEDKLDNFKGSMLWSDQEKILKHIFANDEIVGTELSERYKNLEERKKNMAPVFRTLTFINFYTQPVYAAYLKQGWDYDYFDKPNIEGDLPITQEELEEYLKWIRKGYERFWRNDEFDDDFGNPIRFELIEEGLKATSAGIDGEFDTGDDLVKIRRYDEEIDLTNYDVYRKPRN